MSPSFSKAIDEVRHRLRLSEVLDYLKPYLSPSRASDYISQYRRQQQAVSPRELDWCEGDLLRAPGHRHPVLLIQSIDEETRRVTMSSPRSGNWYVYPLHKLVATHTNETAEERSQNGKG